MNLEDNPEYLPLEINWRTASAYDATLSLLYGLQIANDKCNIMYKNKCMRKKLKDVLLFDRFNDLRIEGALGIINFNEAGDRLDVDGKLGVIVEVKDGKFEIVSERNIP